MRLLFRFYETSQVWVATFGLSEDTENRDPGILACSLEQFCFGIRTQIILLGSL